MIQHMSISFNFIELWICMSCLFNVLTDHCGDAFGSDYTSQFHSVVSALGLGSMGIKGPQSMGTFCSFSIWNGLFSDGLLIGAWNLWSVRLLKKLAQKVPACCGRPREVSARECSEMRQGNSQPGASLTALESQHVVIKIHQVCSVRTQNVMTFLRFCGLNDIVAGSLHWAACCHRCKHARLLRSETQQFSSRIHSRSRVHKTSLESRILAVCTLRCLYQFLIMIRENRSGTCPGSCYNMEPWHSFDDASRYNNLTNEEGQAWSSLPTFRKRSFRW